MMLLFSSPDPKYKFVLTKTERRMRFHGNRLLEKIKKWEIQVE